MKERVAVVLRVAVLAVAAVAAVALVSGVAEARTAAATSSGCYYIPPYYLGACTSTAECISMCDPYWEYQGVGACLGEPICCICE